MGKFEYVDMHFHGSFLENEEAFLAKCEKLGIASLCVDVDLSDDDSVASFQALGFHPWWVDKYHNEELRVKVNRFIDLLPNFKHFGELGLDFSKKYEANSSKQLKIFVMLIKLILGSQLIKTGFKPCVSLHAYKANDIVLDQLEEINATRHMNIILHSFNGSQRELNRAIKLGCYFSFGIKNLETKKGRDYIQKIPLDKLLLESDLPKEEGDSALTPEEYKSILEDTVVKIHELRKDKDALELLEFRQLLADNAIDRLNGE